MRHQHDHSGWFCCNIVCERLTTRRYMASIKHPVAYSEAAQAIIRIADAPRSQGMLYSCLHCGQRMSAVVLVTQKTPHFRHTAPETQCDPDDALHTYAIKMIQQAHAEAQENGVPYTLTRGCEKCGEGYSTNIDLADGWDCAAEKLIVSAGRGPTLRSLVQMVDNSPLRS